MILPTIGEVIAGKYRVDEVLGEGSFGRVYRGTTDLSERPVAIKVLKPGRQGYDLKRTQRYFRELRAIAKLQSPHTLTLFDYGKTDAGLLYMVTEFIDGKDLNEVLAERGTLSERETAHVLMQLLQSLEEAHAAGVLHRDIKPSNIRVFSYQGDPLRTKLLDFGLALSLRVQESRLTATGMVVGTPRYMSPEQILGHELTAASDIFSLGLVALDCVQGRTAHRPALEVPHDTNVSPLFRDVLNKMLAESMDARFRTASEVYDALRGVRRPAPPKPQRRVKRPPQPVERPPTTAQTRDARSHVTWALAGIVLLAIAMAGFAIWTARPVPEAPAVSPARHAALLKSEPPARVDVELCDAGKTSTADAARNAPRNGCGVVPPVLGEVVLRTHEHYLQAGDGVPIYLPKSYDPDRAHPVIIAFHDYPGGPWGVIRRSGLDKLADQHGVVIVAVEDRIQGMEGIWTSRRDAARAHSAAWLLTEHFCIDRSRIFAYGHGVGGRGVEQMMCDFEHIAAGATTSYRPHASAPPRCDKSKPRLHIDPQNSRSLPVDGNARCGTFDEPVLPSDDYEKELRERADCSRKSSVWMKHAEGTCRTWACETALVSCRVRGGRELPGTAPREGFGINPECDGAPGNFPHTEAIWKFFEEVAPQAQE